MTYFSEDNGKQLRAMSMLNTFREKGAHVKFHSIVEVQSLPRPITYDITRQTRRKD
ncbi:hypothetical protein ACUY4R_003218 [Kosakonia sp. BK9b]